MKKPEIVSYTNVNCLLCKECIDSQRQGLLKVDSQNIYLFALFIDE